MGLLRFILAITVVIAHSSSIFGFTFVGGVIAVQAFYIISGFYMTMILNEKYIGVNDSYKLFISNRLLRLYPIYWSVLFLTILFSLALTFYTNGKNSGNFTIYKDYFDTLNLGSFIFLIFTNVFLFLQDIVMFLGLDTSSGNLFFTSNFIETSPQLHKFLFIPQAWTIGVEISFYLIAPFLVRKKIKLIILLIFLSLFLRFGLTQYGMSNDPWSYRFFPTELVFFLLGIISYNIYLKIRYLEIKKAYLYMIFFSVIGSTVLYDFIFISYKYSMYLILFFICLPFIFLLTKNWKYDSYIGELSYPIYISHMFMYSIIITLKLPIFFGLGLTLTALTILFSIFLNELIAKKIEIIRQKRITSNLK